MQDAEVRSQRASSGSSTGEFPPLGVTTHRRLAVEVHDHVRRLILAGALSPGTVIRQAEFARKLGVSRTPMREAFRMLQEEGLITHEPNQRSVVLGIDIADLDSAYAMRVLMESLAVKLSVPVLGAPGIAALEEAYRAMHERRWEHQVSDEWRAAHRAFHAGLAVGADAQLRHQVATMADRTTHYLRLAQFTDISMWSEGQFGHEAVLAAAKRGDSQEAARAMAVHLATTARRVVYEVNPELRLTAIATALDMIGVPHDLA
ncbi:MAG TPA: GntR family transcriptional regulator [Trebonia sp.]